MILLVVKQWRLGTLLVAGIIVRDVLTLREIELLIRKLTRLTLM